MSDWKQVLRAAANHSERYLDGIGTRPVRATMSGDGLRAALGGPFAAQGASDVEVIDALAAAAAGGTVATQGPRYFGFVVGGSLPVGDRRRLARRPPGIRTAGSTRSRRSSSVVEDIAASWLRDLAGLPASWSVGFVTGCQMANFTALAAARHHVLDAPAGTSKREGLFGAPPIDVVVSDESHYTIFSALEMLGLGLRAADARFRPTGRAGCAPTRWRRRSRGGSGPCIVCAQAGNVNTGAFDPIAGDRRRREGARRVAARRRRVRLLGVREPGSASLVDGHRAAPTRSPPTRTSG